MPLVYVDQEGAELVEAAVQMLEAALTARVKRADPDQFISNSLILQSHKLSSFRTMLHAPDPPEFSMLAEPLRKKAFLAASQLVAEETPAGKDAAWRLLRGLSNAHGHR